MSNESLNFYVAFMPVCSCFERWIDHVGCSQIAKIDIVIIVMTHKAYLGEKVQDKRMIFYLLRLHSFPCNASVLALA